MFTATIADLVEGVITSEQRAIVHNAARTLEAVFQRTGWTWYGGEAVTADMLVQTILLRLVDCAEELRKDSGQNVATVDSGRVMVTAQRVGRTHGPLARFEIALHAPISNLGHSI